MTLLMLFIMLIGALMAVSALPENDNTAFTVGGIGLVIMLVCGIFSEEIKESKGYKQGQIDALTGTVKYELVMHLDSTKTWEEINNEEK